MKPSEAKGLTLLGHAEAVRIPNREDRAFLKRIARGVVVRAVIAGGLVGLTAATTERWAQDPPATAIAKAAVPARVRPRKELDRPAPAPSPRRIAVGALVAQTLLLGSLLELLFIAWTAHRAARNTTRCVGLPPFPEVESFERGEMPGLLARAALYLPLRPPPLSKLEAGGLPAFWWVGLSFAAYQAKLLACTVGLRWLLRWTMGPPAEPWLAWIPVPVFAAWNGLWLARVTRELRLRALGPGMAHEVLQAIFSAQPAIGPLGRPAVLRAVETAVGKSGTAHPHQVVLLTELRRRLGSASGDPKETWRHFLDKVSMLSKVEQKVLLQCLAATISLGGARTATDFQLLREALVACNKPASDAAAWRLHRALAKAEPFPVELLDAIGS